MRVPDDRETARGEREQLELRLRTHLDDDDAVSAVGEMLDAGWLPPSEHVAALAELRAERDELRTALKRIGRAHASAEHLQSIADDALASGKEPTS